MSSIKRKPKQLLNTISINLGCSSCMKPKLSSIFSPKSKSSLPKYHHQRPLFHYSSYSRFMDYPPSSSANDLDPCFRVGHFRVVGSKTVAVEKESKDPYLDFRHSMLQMIVENEMNTKDELKELLNCFLQLNSASLHGVIIRVFADICDSFFFKDAAGAPHHHERGHGNNDKQDILW